MKSSELFVAALKQGLSPVEALHHTPNYEPRYIHRVPVEIYLAALQKGWRFFPVSSKHHAVTHANLFQATDDVQKLKLWARKSPYWALATGSQSGVFVLEVNGREGLTSLLDLCGDDWDWLDTLRSMAGEKRCISFACPESRRQISDREIGKGLSVLGDGDWVLVLPCRDPIGIQHTYLNLAAEAIAAPLRLLDRAFEPANTADPSRPFPPHGSVVDAWSSTVLAEANHD